MCLYALLLDVLILLHLCYSNIICAHCLCINHVCQKYLYFYVLHVV